MKEKQRTHEPIPHNSASGDPGSDDLAATQKQMNALLAAGDAAISAALSKDSAAFLAATHQRGGQ
jgi:hypothetical protein